MKKLVFGGFSLHHSHPYNYKYESPTVLRWPEGNEEDLVCNIWQDFVIQLKQRKQCSGGAGQWNRKLSFYCETCTDLQYEVIIKTSDQVLVFLLCAQKWRLNTEVKKLNLTPLAARTILISSRFLWCKCLQENRVIVFVKSKFHWMYRFQKH